MFAEVLDGKLELLESDDSGTKLLFSIPVEVQEIERPSSDKYSCKSINNSSYNKGGVRRLSVPFMVEQNAPFRDNRELALNLVVDSGPVRRDSNIPRKE